MLGYLLQSLASSTTIIQMWFYGNKSIQGPIWGIISNLCWWSVMFHHELWGVAPVNAVMLFINLRNWYKWEKEKTNGSPNSRTP